MGRRALGPFLGSWHLGRRALGPFPGVVAPGAKSVRTVSWGVAPVAKSVRTVSWWRGTWGEERSDRFLVAWHLGRRAFGPFLGVVAPGAKSVRSVPGVFRGRATRLNGQRPRLEHASRGRKHKGWGKRPRWLRTRRGATSHGRTTNPLDHDMRRLFIEQKPVVA